MAKKISKKATKKKQLKSNSNNLGTRKKIAKKSAPRPPKDIKDEV